MTYATLEYTQTGPVARIVLNRPEVLNAITKEMSEELLDALGRVHSPEIRAVLLTGAGRAFSAGADLGANWDPSEPVDLLGPFETLWNPLIMGLRELPKPVVSAVNGAAVGYACALALCADVVVASEKAFFLTAAASAGILPDGGLTALLPASLGLARASAMVMLGERLSAPRAHKLGLVSHCCPPDELESLSTEIAETLAAGPTLTFAATKRALNAHAYPQLAAQLQLEAEIQQELTETHDYMEGTAAFKERRPAVFRGE